MKEDFSNSKLFKLLKAELDEVDRLKWIESEKAHHDIGRNAAILLWMRRHHKKWLKEYLAKGLSSE